MLQGRLLKLVKVESRCYKVIGNGQFVRAEWQPVLEPREVIDRLWTTCSNTPSNVSPGLLELTKVVLRAGQNLPAGIWQPWNIGVAEAIRAHAILLKVLYTLSLRSPTLAGGLHTLQERIVGIPGIVIVLLVERRSRRVQE